MSDLRGIRRSIDITFDSTHKVWVMKGGEETCRARDGTMREAERRGGAVQERGCGFQDEVQSGWQSRDADQVNDRSRLSRGHWMSVQASVR